MNVGPTIRTRSGVVRGNWVGGVAVFRGIPYAQPPVGPRRFGPPLPAQPWDGVRDAVEFGPPAPQPGVVKPSSGSQAWLTLNVWSPDTGATGLPVMVWIHGGRYLQGSASNPLQDGTTFAKAGVVMVSMNYRVGAEGFAYIAGAPNNRGILDQIAALQWVKDNVAAFGGDPDNVTVFGQSAGAGCIAALLAMPSANGLFHRAIAQSLPGTYFTERLAAAISAEIAAQLGTEATAGALAGRSPRELVDAATALLNEMPSYTDTWGAMALTPTPFSPIVDGTTLPHAPWRSLADGVARGVELLVGHTRDEYSLFNTWRGEHVTNEQVSASLDLLTPDSGTGVDEQYRAAYPEADPGQLKEIINADWLFRMPSHHLAAAQHAGGGTAWLYELCWSFNPDEGASHSLDVLLVFGTLSAADIRSHHSAYPSATTEVDGISRAMRADWVNFASSGDPGWTPYAPDAGFTRVYDAEAVVRPYPEERSRQIWSRHRFDALDLAPRHADRPPRS